MLKPLRFSLTCVAISLLMACQSSSNAPQTPSMSSNNTVVKQSISNVLTRPASFEEPSVQSDSDLITLEKIMSDPDWLGRFADNVGWSVLGDHIVFERKRHGSSIKDVFQISPENIVINGELASLKNIHLLQAEERVVSQNQRFIAWIYDDIGFIYDAQSRSAHSFSHGQEAVSQLQFMLDGRLSFKQGSHIHVIDPESFKRQSLFSWAFADKPVAVKPGSDYIAQEQISLIKYIQVKRQQRQEQSDYQQQLIESNSELEQVPFYFDKDYRLSAVSVAPN